MIIDSLYNYKKKYVKNLTPDREQNYYDQAVENAFHIYRHWFKFTVPKVFRVVDSLQRYVCEKHGKKPGSYSYFVQQLENDFLQENVSILVEYGLPRSSAEKIEELVPKEYSEDEVIEFIRQHKDQVMEVLSEYERERFLECIM